MLKTKKTKDNKSFSLFFISDLDNPYIDEISKLPNILSIVSTEDEAKEYIEKRLLVENFDHYKSWCELRDYQLDNDSWAKYKVNLRNPYTYSPTEVNYSTAAGLLRIFYGCAPIGCSFDTIIEKSTFLAQSALKEEEEEKVAKA